VNKGQTIQLSVSKGPATIQVPDVRNQDQSTAEALLTQAGLTPAVTYEQVTDPSQDGIVINQDPAPGSDAKSGEVVIINVGQLQAGVPGGDGTTTTATTTTP
jgi:eukaryotic-like serine/threonine-protein kinase